MEHALREVAERRSQVYWFLSRLFIERPDAAYVSELKAALPGGQEDDGDSKALRSALAHVRTVLADVEKGDFENLSVEFTRLLRGIHAKGDLAPPFESLYLSGPDAHEVTLRVVSDMAAAGFGDVLPEAGPQDHIAAELRFLALLCFREAEAWSAGCLDDAEAALGRQRAFLDQHVLRWVPSYCKRLANDSREAFYGAVAALAAAALDDDRHRVDELLKECGIIRQEETARMPDRVTGDD